MIPMKSSKGTDLAILLNSVKGERIRILILIQRKKIIAEENEEGEVTQSMMTLGIERRIAGVSTPRMTTMTELEISTNDILETMISKVIMILP
jgi:hypothetical protein